MCPTLDYYEAKGREEGREMGIRAVFEICYEIGVSKEAALAKVMEKFALTETEAQSDMMKFWEA